MNNIKNVTLVNTSGKTVDVKIGYSFTTFFFGAFAPLLRGQWIFALMLFVVQSVLMMAMISAGVQPIVGTLITCGVAGYFRNKNLLEMYRGKGYAITKMDGVTQKEVDGFLDYSLTRN